MQAQIYTIGLVNPKQETPFVTMRIHSYSKEYALMQARDYFQPNYAQKLVVVAVKQHV